MTEGVIVARAIRSADGGGARWRWRLARAAARLAAAARRPAPRLLRLSGHRRRSASASPTPRCSIPTTTTRSQSYTKRLGATAICRSSCRTTFIFVVASVVLPASPRPARRDGAASRRRSAACTGVTFIRIVILASWIVPGVAGGHRLAADVQRGELRFPQRRPPADGPAAGRLALRPEHRDLVGGARQCLARHRLQHDPALCRPGRHSGEPLRGRRGRRRHRVPAVPAT